MPHFENLIISASAGTGKTYRLSLEYIALVVRYYEHESFALDGILALTFTKKATYEIRERILTHLVSLIKNQDPELLADLCKILQRPEPVLQVREQGALISAYQEILSDRRKLQVMTIDSYISNVFRNIVRPLRSIDNYEIDLSAINKRMPYLLAHLMQPEIRQRIYNLLQRKVKPALDDYASLFGDLIKQRWLYYVIRYRCPQNVFDLKAGDELNVFRSSLHELLMAIEQQMKAGADLGSYFNSEFQSVIQQEITDVPALLARIEEVLQSPNDAHKLLKALAAKNIFSGNRIRNAEVKEHLSTIQSLVTQALADHLYFSLFLPEQQEIMELWELVLKEYDRLIYRYKNMTYDDISWFTFEALFSQEPPAFDLSIENTATEFYHFLSHRTRFMLIDEFQDTSLIQFNILRPIIEEICAGLGSKDLGGVIVVGDEKQSIFGWRGGERDLLLNLKNIIGNLANARSDVLDDSWRSSRDMMDFINNIFEHPRLHDYLNANDMQWHYPEVRSAIGDLPTCIELKCSPYSRAGGDSPKTDVLESFVNNMIIPNLGNKNNEKIAILCRKGKQLNNLQILLEEKGETGIFQPSASLVEHSLVSPLLAWMRFVVYKDWYSLLSLLRSDYLMLDSRSLKQAVDAISRFQEQHSQAIQDYSQLCLQAPFLAQWLELSQKHSTQKPYQSLRELCGCLISDVVIENQRNQLNLEAFLALVKDWELNHAKMGAGMADLLDYIDDNYMQDSFKQVSIEGEEHLQLLTIHKSKGLQFDRVFVFYDLSDSRANDHDKLYWSYRYSQRLNTRGEAFSSFQDIDAFALSFHYEDVLKHSSAKALWEQKRRQTLLEELNTLYVAFTRAKTSLHICFGYAGKDSWPDYFAARDEDNLKLPAILANACMEYFASASADINGIYRFQSEYPQTKTEVHDDTQTCMQLSIRPESVAEEMGVNWEAYLPVMDDTVKNWKAVYLEQRQHLYGDLLHYYLSFIHSDTGDEHRMAASQCISRYGSLLPETTLKSIFESGKRELRKHSYLFDPAFDKVFTELPIGHLRIDRLMLNSTQKLALVIDYKTGGIHEQEQIEHYIQALKRIPALKDYSFESRYVQLLL
ncbi:MAG: UvrD-helicase domain-containing protein [Candidatus Cloacimonetes bacterium]|nr:UvrD-helicase domain-containing protein [Candidatus Cloacimonadota bacterium]MDD4035444.1 UvrD-helicase domain-containing protein [Candidatus Cloacimonadota bacterium]